MHIVFLADNFPPEGNAIASRVYERACYWVRWGHQVTVITSAPNFPEGKLYPGYKNKWYQVEFIDGIKVVRVKTFIAKNKGFILRIIDFISYIFPALFAGLVQKKADVIVATTPQLFVACTAFTLAIMKRAPFILEVADIWPASIVGVGAMKENILILLLEKLEIFLYKRATAIVVLTPAFKHNLTSRGIKANKIHIVLNGVDLNKYMPQKRDDYLANQYQIERNQFVIGYLGTHGMAHDLKNVLRAASVLSKNKNILFLFVGAGAERDELIEYAKRKNLPNVKFISTQPKNVMTSFWSVCDISLIHLKNDPVFSEVIPSKIFESMGMGLPILIAAPIGEASTIVTKHQVGMWVPAGNPTALANAIIILKDQADLRETFAKNSYKTAFLYSRERQAKEMLTIIEKYSAPSLNMEVNTDE